MLPNHNQMIYTNRTTLFSLLLSLALFTSCEELVESLNECQFSYGPISFTQGPPSQTQEISPVFSEGEISGTFSSQPNGLVLNEETGIININESDPGEYTITHEGETTCETRILILEGIQECQLNYGTSIVAPGEVDFLLARVDEKPTEGGKFYAIPDGLAISSTNGSIDVAASEAGIEYMVYYESEDGNTFCQTQITISGINYTDTKVDFDQEEGIINPVYVEDGEQQAPGGNYDLNGNAREENLSINPETGAIDLRATLQAIDEAEFGCELAPGFSRTFTISYVLPEEEIASSIELQIFWYENVDQIPDDIVEVFEGKGIPINGKIEKRPPYILTVGDYEQ